MESIIPQSAVQDIPGEIYSQYSDVSPDFNDTAAGAGSDVPICSQGRCEQRERDPGL